MAGQTGSLASTPPTPPPFVVLPDDTDTDRHFAPLHSWSAGYPIELPDTPPTGKGQSCAWSPNGRHLVIGHEALPWISLYRRTGSTLTKLADPDILPTNRVSDTAWTRDGRFLAVTHLNGPGITVYERSGDTFTKLDDPADVLTETGISCAWSPDGRYLAVGHFKGSGTSGITIYRRSGLTLQKIDTPEISTGLGNGASCAWSPDGRFLTIAATDWVPLRMYKLVGDDHFQEVEDIPVPEGDASAYDVEWSPDGRYLAFAASGIYLWEYGSDVFKRTPLGGSVGCCAWSPDGRFLAVGQGGGSPVHVFERDGAELTEVPNVTLAPESLVADVSWSPDGRFLALAHWVSLGESMTVYETRAIAPVRNFPA